MVLNEAEHVPARLGGRSGEVAAKIAALSERNRTELDMTVELELLRLRHERFLALGGDAASLAAPPGSSLPPVGLDPAVGLAVAQSLPSAAVVRSTIQMHGSLVVRGLLGAVGVD